MNQEPNGSAQTNSTSNFCQAKLFKRDREPGAGGQSQGLEVVSAKAHTPKSHIAAACGVVQVLSDG